MKRLGTLLTELGWISSEQLEHALQMQEVLGGRLGTNLLELDALSEERLQTALGHLHGVPAARARDLRRVPREVHDLLPARLAHRWKAVPFRMLGRELHVALLDVSDLGVINELAFATDKSIRSFVANEARLACSLEDHYQLTASPRIRQLVDRLDHDESALAPRRSAPSWQPHAHEPHGRGQEAGFQRHSVTESDTGEQGELAEAVETVEVGAEDPTGSSAPEPDEASAELARWHERVERLDDRDRIARALLDVLVPHFRRVVLIKLARGFARGWLGTGPGVDTSALRRLKIDMSEPSVFFNLAHGASHHIGTLAPMPPHEELASAWGGGLPGDCIVLAVRVSGRLVCAVFCEPGFAAVDAADRSITVADLVEICESAGRAFARCVLQHRLVPDATRATRSSTSVRLPAASSGPIQDVGRSSS